jgi:hypothetical protein
MSVQNAMFANASGPENFPGHGAKNGKQKIRLRQE